MIAIHPQYITDHTGKKISAILPMKQYKNMIEELEELKDIQLYDSAKASNEPSYPIDDAFKMIDAKRKKRGV